MTRTPEQGHTKKCAAHALINAVENVRDLEYMTDADFRLAMRDGTFAEWADEYLASGTVTCLCPDGE